MTTPRFDLDKIIYSTSDETYQKAAKLYESGEIGHFRDTGYLYQATVYGSHPYTVSISAKNFDHGDCDCYMGQHDYVCKHIVALAIYAVLRGQPIPKSLGQITDTPRCSGQLGDLSSAELVKIKTSITSALKYIKGYNGPSRTWFAYQDSLSEGSKRLSTIVSALPVSRPIGKIIWQLLLRLNKKLVSGGVDDSDGTVGAFIEGCVDVLLAYIKLDPSCRNDLKLPLNFESSFGWEERLFISLQGPTL